MWGDFISRLGFVQLGNVGLLCSMARLSYIQNAGFTTISPIYSIYSPGCACPHTCGPPLPALCHTSKPSFKLLHTLYTASSHTSLPYRLTALSTVQGPGSARLLSVPSPLPLSHFNSTPYQIPKSLQLSINHKLRIGSRLCTTSRYMQPYLLLLPLLS